MGISGVYRLSSEVVIGKMCSFGFVMNAEEHQLIRTGIRSRVHRRLYIILDFYIHCNRNRGMKYCDELISKLFSAYTVAGPLRLT